MKRYAAAVGLLLALSACGSDGGDAARSPSDDASASLTSLPAPAASSSAGATASPTPAAAASTDLADGRHAARVTVLDAGAGTITVDVVQFLTGEAAEKAAAEDGEEAFDYYIRNQNTRLRTLSLAAAPKVVVNTLSAEETGSSSKDLAISLAKLATYFDQGKAQRALFHLTLSSGVVTEIREQYLP